MDDFSQVAVHTLPRNNVSSSAAHSSTLMVNGGSRALAPLQVTLPASVTSVRRHEVISTTPIEAGFLRTVGKNWSALRTPESPIVERRSRVERVAISILAIGARSTRTYGQ